MIANRNFGGNEPLTWVGKFPVYLATVLAGVQIAAMILTAFAMAVGGDAIEANAILRPLLFSFPDVLATGSVWRYVTYAFVIPPGLAILQIVMFAWFGRDVESFLGRRSFAWLCGLLVLSVPVLLSILSLLGIPVGVNFGSGALSFAVFLSFVMIYPRAQFFFGIEARWIAIAFLGISSLIWLSSQAWVELAMLWWTAAVAAAWLRCEGVSSLQTIGISEALRRRHSEKNLRVVRPEPTEKPEMHESIDPILEKIARRGIGSLTRGEREKLEQARAVLLEKERRD